MTTTSSGGLRLGSPTGVGATRRVGTSVRQDAVMVVVSFWLIGGLFVDVGQFAVVAVVGPGGALDRAGGLSGRVHSAELAPDENQLDLDGCDRRR